MTYFNGTFGPRFIAFYDDVVALEPLFRPENRGESATAMIEKSRVSPFAPLGLNKYECLVPGAHAPGYFLRGPSGLDIRSL